MEGLLTKTGAQAMLAPHLPCSCAVILEGYEVTNYLSCHRSLNNCHPVASNPLQKETFGTGEQAQAAGGQKAVLTCPLCQRGIFRSMHCCAALIVSSTLPCICIECCVRPSP